MSAYDERRTRIKEYRLKLPEVARRLGVSTDSARRYVKAGKIPAAYIGNAYRVSEEDLAAYIERAKVDPKKFRAPTAPQQSFNGLLEEERRTRDLERIEQATRALNARWLKELERDEFAVAEYDEAGRGLYALDGFLADAMTKEVVEDAAWNNAWQAVYDLSNTLQRAKAALDARGVPDTNEYDVPDINQYRTGRRREASTGDERSSEAG